MSQHHRKHWQDTAITRQLRHLALSRAKGRCEAQSSPRCTGRAEWVDHIIPLSRGGAGRDLANLRATCKACARVQGGQLGAAAARQVALRARVERLDAQVAQRWSRQW